MAEKQASALEISAEEDRLRGRCAFRPHEVWRDDEAHEQYVPRGHYVQESWTLPNGVVMHRCVFCGCVFTKEVTP